MTIHRVDEAATFTDDTSWTQNVGTDSCVSVSETGTLFHDATETAAAKTTTEDRVVERYCEYDQLEQQQQKRNHGDVNSRSVAEEPWAPDAVASENLSLRPGLRDAIPSRLGNERGVVGDADERDTLLRVRGRRPRCYVSGATAFARLVDGTPRRRSTAWSAARREQRGAGNRAGDEASGGIDVFLVVARFAGEKSSRHAADSDRQQRPSRRQRRRRLPWGEKRPVGLRGFRYRLERRQSMPGRG